MIFLLFIPHYTTLFHNLIKETLLDLIERAFKNFYKNEGTHYLACNDKKAYLSSTDQRGYTPLCSCQNVCNVLSRHLNNIYIRFTKKFYLNSIIASFRTGHLTELQQQSIITLIPKTGKDMYLLSNWRPINLLNVDYKIANI